MNIYEDSNRFHCFGCGADGDLIDFVSKKEELNFKESKEKCANILGLSKEELMESKENNVVNKNVIIPAMDMDELKEFIRNTGYKSNGLRCIRDEINQFYGHLTKLDENGTPKARYYPETNLEGKVCRYKCRTLPKTFTQGHIGHSGGGKVQLSGQVKFKNGGKYILFVGGEEDKAAAYQMLLDNQKDSDYSSIPVVSPTSGEGTAANQAAQQYEFFDSYDNIIIGMDNDQAGLLAAKAIAEVLPKDKVKIATWTGKDPNKMLEDGKQKQFVRDFWNAKSFIETGVKDSTTMLGAMKEELLTPKISLPPHMHKLQEAMGGGIRQGRIVNIIGDTSAGKSTHVNSLAYFWIFNAPEKVCVVSLEATEGQYALDLASLHLEKNLTWYDDAQEMVDYLDQPEVAKMIDNLMFKEDGSPRYYIIDERDGNIDHLERQMERMFRQNGCKIFIIDVLTDILRSMPEDKQQLHMAWQKKFIKNGATLINALHTRKPGQSSDGTIRKVTEYDALGSGTFVQSAAINIVINRDKMAEGDEKNITYVDMPKCRGGMTGEICRWFYDFKTRQVHDYDDYLGIKYENETKEVVNEVPNNQIIVETSDDTELEPPF